MKPLFLIRLVLDFTAAGLLLVALPYYAFNNLIHELLGTGIFLLLIAHNLFNRRWWGAIAKGRPEPRTVLTKALNLSLLVTMLTLLVTSIMISQAVFSFLPIASTPTARQLHAFSAYWALLIVAFHLGWHWTIVMSAVRSRLGIDGLTATRTLILRCIAGAGAALGVLSFWQLDLTSRLTMQVTLQFAIEPPSLVMLTTQHATVVWLIAYIGHTSLEIIRGSSIRRNTSVM